MIHANAKSSLRNSMIKLRSNSLNAARGLLLTSLVYATWRIGGVDAITLWHVGLVLLATGVLTLLGQPRFGFKTRRLPVLLLAVISLSIAWPAVQTIQLPQTVFNAITTGQHEINANLVGATFDSFAPAFPDANTHRSARRSISVVTSRSEIRIDQWILMGVYVLLTALLFDSRKSRRIFLWTLAINTGFIAVWGLIQRATGTTDLLPGVTRPNVILPFGPFIYKNAGAAAMMPGFAAVVGLLWAAWLPRFGQSLTKPTKAKRGFEYRNSGIRNDQRTIFLLTLAGTSAAGLLMAYSRGAWLAAIVAATVTLLVARKHVTKKIMAMLVAFPLCACLLVVAMTGGFRPVSNRIEDQLSSNYVHADARWEHWKDGWNTATKYFPVGSGLGTYGYSTLAEQSSNSRLWFREAHNHYLETLTEQGLPGLVILLVGGMVLLRIGYSLLSNQVSRERSAIGLTGFSALIAISIQSIFDFVILIPAIMFLFASLFAMVAQTYVSPLSKPTVRTTNELEQGQLRWYTASVLWLAPAMIGLVFSLVHLRERMIVDQVLLETARREQTIPSDITITANLDRLDECIDRYKGWPELHQRRAYWNIAQVRMAIRRSSARAGGEIDWESTSPSTLFQKVMALPTNQRNLVVDDIAIDSDIREPLRTAIRDLTASIEMNPFLPENYLSAALLAPTMGIQPNAYNESLVRLSHSNPRLQFMSGLIHHYTGNEHCMITQWHRSLKATSPEFEQMVRVCLKTMSLRELVERLIPADRSSLLLPMVRSLDADQMLQLRSNTQLQRFIEDRIQADHSNTPAQRHALLAMFATDLDQNDRAAVHWTAAVANDRSNSNYRYHYCQTLLKRRNYEELFKQCSLGKALEPQGDRFGPLMESARKEMKSKDH